MAIDLESMAIEMPVVAGHPNRRPFCGVLTLVDVPSDRAPAGARGHRVVLTRAAAETALASLLGMALDYSPSLDHHDARRKVGIITNAEISGRQLELGGYLFARDFPELVKEIAESSRGRTSPQGSSRDLGMSYEVADVRIADLRDRVWTLTHVTFTGAAILRRDPASVASQRRGIDDGVHGVARHIKSPVARTAIDCENAALALLDDATGAPWIGEYETWSDFLPGNAADIFPGDGLTIDVPSREAAFYAIVREVHIAVRDLKDDHSIYNLKFANDAAESLSLKFEESRLASWSDVTELANTQVGGIHLPDLTTVEVTQVTSTTVTLNTGTTSPAGGGFEVRWSDVGWGPDNDRNLVGRFTSQTLTIPRLSRVQNCYLRQYDASNPPRYSRYTAALHVDYPL